MTFLSRAASLAVAILAASPAFADATFRRVTQDITLNPSTGVTSGRASIEVEAVGAAVSTLYVSLDLGLRIDSASVSVTQTAFQSWNVGTVTFSPPLPAGSRRVVDLAWSGTLRCTANGTSAACDLSPSGVSRIVASSALVLPSAAEPRVQRYPQDVTLRLPTGTKVVGTGDLVSDTDDGATRTARFQLQRSEMSAQTYFFGATAVPLFNDGGVKVTLNHAPDDVAWAPRLPGMFDRIVPWLQQSVGAPLPYRDVQLVKLAPYHRELGYTAPSLINLSAWHGSFDDALFEEEWAHEMTHFFFGCAVSPEDAAQTRLVTEGMTVLHALDYRAQRQTTRERELYLAHRTREAELLLRYESNLTTLSPPVLRAGAQPPTAGTSDWTWAYAHGPAVLDYLRTFIGDESYAQGLKAFVARCSFASCTTDTLKQELAKTTTADVAGFFDRFVYANTWPRLEVALERKTPTSVTVRLSQATSASVPVELWVELEDGRRERHAVALEGALRTLELTTSGPVRAVRPNPRQDAILWSSSSVEGDVDFDGAVDGLDVLACAFRFGKKVDANFMPGTESLTGLDLDFEPRCDLVTDGELDDGDLNKLLGRFGEGTP